MKKVLKRVKTSLTLIDSLIQSLMLTMCMMFAFNVNTALADGKEFVVEFDASGGEKYISLDVHTSYSNPNVLWSASFFYDSYSCNWITGLNVLGYHTTYDTYTSYSGDYAWWLQWDSLLYDNGKRISGKSVDVTERNGNAIQLQIFCDKNSGQERNYRAKINSRSDYLTIKQKGVTSELTSVVVAFNSMDGAICNSQSYKIGYPYGSLPTPTKSNCTFSGWYSDTLFQNQVIASTIVSASVKTLYAKWTDNNTKTISISPSEREISASGGPAKVSIKCTGTWTESSSPSGWGGSYWHWTTMSSKPITGNFTGEYYVEPNTNTSPRTIIIAFKCGSQKVTHAVIQEGASLTYTTVSFNSNGGSSCQQRQYVVGKDYGSLPTPVKNGFTFEGWYSNSSLSERVNPSSTVSSSIKTLFAKWEQNTPTFSVNASGGLYHVALNGCRSVIIPDNVTYISSRAFTDCGDLSSVTIPESVNSIDSNAFSACSNIVSVMIPQQVLSNTVRIIYPYAKYYGLQATFPDSFQKIKAVSFQSNVTKINAYAFRGCASIENITIPDTVTYIDYNAFENCTKLNSVTLGHGLRSIYSSAFEGCENLSSVYAQDLDSWLSISFSNEKANPLYYAHNLYLNGNLLTEATIPSGFTKIKNYAFCNCNGLTTINIAPTVMEIGDGAFHSCSNLVKVSLPNSITNINQKAFYKCSNLSKINLPDTIDSIKYLTFYKCEGLTEITVPASVKSIDRESFSGCSQITKVIIPDSVKRIDEWAFCGCAALEKVEIPSTTTTISSTAFEDCPRIQQFDVAKNNSHFSTINGMLSNKEATQIISGTCIEELSIPNGVVSIAVGAFQGRTNLRTIQHLPESLASIGSAAFWGCTNLQMAVIPQTVTNLGVNAFNKCTEMIAYVSGNPHIDTYWGQSAFDQMAKIKITDNYHGEITDNMEVKLSLSQSNEQFLSAPIKLSVSCGIPNAEIRYTTDGTMPNNESALFKPFTVKKSITVTVGAFVGGERILTAQGTYWFGEVSQPEISIEGNLTFTGAQTRQVSMSCATMGATIYYTLNGAEPTQESLTYTEPFVISLAPDDQIALRAIAFKDGFKPSTVTEVMLTREWTLADGVNAPSLVFETGGDIEWVRDPTIGHLDGESLKSGAISDNENSWLETIVNGEGQISFHWKTSCEKTDDAEFPWDRIEFYVDDVLNAWQDGVADEWHQIVMRIKGSGRHSLRWVYVKDSSDASGEDCAWIDDVVWTPIGKGDVTVVEVSGVSVEFVPESDGRTRTAKVVAGTKAEDIVVTVGGADVTKGFFRKIEGTKATIALLRPYEVSRENGTSDEPWVDDGEGDVTLNIEIVPGLYYAAASAVGIDMLKCPGSDSPATAETTLTVKKPKGEAQGFYKVWVSDSAITAE